MFYMLQQAVREMLLAFFSGLGVVLGGSLSGALAAFFTRGSPLALVRQLADMLRLWAVLAAIGGTFPTIRIIESGLLYGQLAGLLRQLAILLAALSGAYLGYWLIITLTGGE